MKVTYKGFDIEVVRDWCIGGWKNVYVTAFRQSDGLEVINYYTHAEDPLRDFMKWTKEQIDECIKTCGASECVEDEW